MYRLPITRHVVRSMSSSRGCWQKSSIFDASHLNPLRSSDETGSKSDGLAAPKRPQQVESESTGFSFEVTPREDALSSKLTGVAAGRTVDIRDGNTSMAFGMLNSILQANRVPQDRRAQRFYLKPGKVAEQKKSQRHRKEFMMGFKRLIEIVKDAKRKGY